MSASTDVYVVTDCATCMFRLDNVGCVGNPAPHRHCFHAFMPPGTKGCVSVAAPDWCPLAKRPTVVLGPRLAAAKGRR